MCKLPFDQDWLDKQFVDLGTIVSKTRFLGMTVEDKPKSFWQQPGKKARKS